MTGYINNSLSVARMGDHNILNEFSPNQMVTAGGLNVSHCRLDLTSCILSSGGGVILRQQLGGGAGFLTAAHHQGSHC